MYRYNQELNAKYIEAILITRCTLLRENGLPRDAFLPVELQKVGQQRMKAAWQISEEGHTVDYFLSPCFNVGLDGDMLHFDVGFGIVGGRSPCFNAGLEGASPILRPVSDSSWGEALLQRRA